MTDKEAQLKAKLLKMKLAESDYQTRNRLDKAKSPMSKEVPFGKDKRKKSEIRDDVLDKTISEDKGTKIRPKTPTQADRARIITAKAKVNKLKTAIVKSPDKYKVPREMKHTRVDSDGPLVNKVPFGEEDRETKQQGMDRIMRDSSYDVKNKKVRPPTPTQADRKRIITAQEHHHKITFRGHKIGGFKGASLNGQSGKYAKYWLLNAKETNGNGWGIAAHTAKENMKKFIGRPLVVTAQSWHGASEYGDEYEHPYLPTNDINAILNHQEKFRVGSIVDVFEDKHGDWFASIEMLPKFASSRLPPFCSPAIYQLDASEAEGQISKWEALHLAALTENPAYGARIALLKGTCVGTDNECKVQFKSAKQESGIECPVKEKQKKVKSKLSKLKKKQKISKLKTRLAGNGIFDGDDKGADDIIGGGRKIIDKLKGYRNTQDPIYSDQTNTPLVKEVPFGKKRTKKQINTDSVDRSKFEKSDGTKLPDNKKRFKNIIIAKLKAKLANVYQNEDGRITLRGDEDEVLDSTLRQISQGGVDASKYKHKPERYYPKRTRQQLKKRNKIVGDIRLKGMMDLNQDSGMTGTQEFEDTFNMDNLEDVNKSTDVLGVVRKIKMKNKGRKGTSLAKLKLKLANLGEQNMTYQDSKKVKIHKKKHPEVRKAKSSVEDILRGKGRSVDGSHAEASFMSSTGDFIGGGETHVNQILDVTNQGHLKNGIDAGIGDEILEDFLMGNPDLIRVQNFPINKAGTKKMNFDMRVPPNNTQLKSMKDSEIEGTEIGFNIGNELEEPISGTGYKNLVESLKKYNFERHD